MAAPLQQVGPIPNGGIPIMSGIPAGVPQAIVYQQQPVMMPGGGPQQMQYAPRKPYVPRERNPQEEQCKIFVGAVGKNTTEESLRAYFGKFGEIADSVIMMNKQTGEPRGFAFVTFKSSDAVQAVIEQCNNGGHTLDGKMYLQVRKYFPKAEYDAEKANGGGVVSGSGIPAAGSPQFQYKGPMKVAPELKIFVGGIGIGTTEEDVKRYFSGFGKVSAVNMPRDFNTKTPRGFAFVGFESVDTVLAVVKDRYHQINGKTVEVKGADEQQAHLTKKHESNNMGRGGGQKFPQQQIQPGNIATVSGYGAYASFAAAPQQLIVPQNVAAQYAAVQVPTAAAAAGGGYVFDPATNTYYQLPGAMLGGGGGLVTSVGGAAVNPYAGMALVGGGGAGQQLLTSQLRPGQVTAEMLGGIPGSVALGSIYPNETSTFGPQRNHLLGSGVQPSIVGNSVADPHVVYSNSTSISAGDVISTAPRGFHPYGR